MSGKVFSVSIAVDKDVVFVKGDAVTTVLVSETFIVDGVLADDHSDGGFVGLPQQAQGAFEDGAP